MRNFNAVYQLILSALIIDINCEILATNLVQPYAAPLKNCSTAKDCNAFQFCVANICECKPQYIWDSGLELCRLFRCASDSECKSIDSHRFCHSDLHFCDCLRGYHLSSDTMKCENTCDYDSDCGKSSNRMCYDGSCVCKPNYKNATADNTCVYSNCSLDSDCNFPDPHRHCKDGSCVCNDDYAENRFSSLCEYYNSSSASLWVWLWLLFFVPTVFFFCIIFYLRRRKPLYNNFRTAQSNVDYVTRY